MYKYKHTISGIEPESIAQEMGIGPGDILLAINNHEVEDVFDYHYLVNDEYIELLIQKPDGEEWLLEIEKEYEDELGIQFENSLMDQYRSCSNKCVFCFIDQMPPGMRETLYFKDDDSRLSFLQGNYITLTNMSDRDIDRILQYHLSPINISVHTTNPKLRCEMLHNRFAGDVLSKMKRLYEGGIEMNGQIVLCKGLNDDRELDKTIGDLSAFWPHMKSLSVVPVGLSKYRQGLYPLESFSKEDSIQVLELIHKWRERLYKKYNNHFVHASDEWYLMAEQPFPQDEAYDGYPQLENGVGMIRLLLEEVESYVTTLEGDDRDIYCTIATGKAAGGSIEKCLEIIRKKYPRIKVKICEITNDFFGEKITVAGLITGQDLQNQLYGVELGEKLLIPCHMLRSGENVFLDDKTVDEIEENLKIPIVVIDQKGEDLVRGILNPPVKGKHRRRQIYEQTNCGNCGKA